MRPDDLAATAIRAVMERNPGLDPAAVEDIILGCANQAGEDNRNVARMAGLLSGLPVDRAGATLLNQAVRLGSGCGACNRRPRHQGRRGPKVMIAGGVESMSREPFVMGKADTAFSRTAIDRGHHHRLALRETRS